MRSTRRCRPAATPYTALPNPLPGLWYVGQGPFTHLAATPATGATTSTRPTTRCTRSRPIGSTNLADNFSFGQPILAPVAGTVYSLVNDEPGPPALRLLAAPEPPNFLFLEIPGNLGLLFSHTKQGTIPFSQGNPVAAGALVGRVGHSGAVGWPHLHYGAETIPAPNPNIGVPLGISNAKVGLNPTASDPWRRDVASWGIREGFFVLPEPAARVSRSPAVLGAARVVGSAPRASPPDSRASAASSAMPAAEPEPRTRARASCVPSWVPAPRAKIEQ